MVTLVLSFALFLGAFAGMEVLAYFTHRYVMHGVLWCLHRSHHRPREHRFELNDLFGVFFALPSIAFIYFGVRGQPYLLSLGLGMAVYGAAYFLFHDVIVHRRVPIGRQPRFRYLSRLTKAHLLHHRTTVRDGATSFGFLYAPRASVRSNVTR